MNSVRQKKGSTKTRKSLFADTLSEMLMSSLMEKRDFIITFEPPDEEKSIGQVHVMTGPLINSCMLNTLKHRVSLYSDEGARVMTRRWD